MKRLVVFDNTEARWLYVQARGECEYVPSTGELRYGDDVDYLAVVTDMESAQRYAGMEFASVVYKCMPDPQVMEFLASRVR